MLLHSSGLRARRGYRAGRKAAGGLCFLTLAAGLALAAAPAALAGSSSSSSGYRVAVQGSSRLAGTAAASASRGPGTAPGAIAAAGVAATMPVGGSPLAAAAGGAWGTAREIPGSAALNTRGDAVLLGMSCGAAGSCSAGGFYAGTLGGAFVVSQEHGTWGRAQPVPGLAALGKGNISEVATVSCAAAGSCSAAGFYSDGGFVVDEVHGTWGMAQRVPGLTALGTLGTFGISLLSCSAAGDCSGAGTYTDSAGRTQVFVVGEVRGIWGTARPVPGLVALNTGGSGGLEPAEADIGSLSCAAPGDCGASGMYTGSAGSQGFVVAEVHGIWRRAQPVPGRAALNTGGYAEISSMSCAAVGQCSAAGFYADRAGHGLEFVVAERNGTWRRVRPVPGLAALGHGGITSMSCAAAGQCSAAGTYADRAGREQAFVVAERNSTWQRAQQVPGFAALNKGRDDEFGISVSCSAAGDCSAGGFYTDRAGRWQGFVVDEVHGHWHRAQQVPGTATLNKGGNANINALSCAPAGSCSAGGSYIDGAGHRQVFIVSKP